MTEKLFGVDINPRYRPDPAPPGYMTAQMGVCTRHTVWYTGEKECPDCFKEAHYPWWKKPSIHSKLATAGIVICVVLLGVLVI